MRFGLFTALKVFQHRDFLESGGAGFYVEISGGIAFVA
jgi:hypothetical protein